MAHEICHFITEKGTGAEICPAIDAGIITRDAAISYWPIFSPVPRDSPTSLCKS